MGILLTGSAPNRVFSSVFLICYYVVCMIRGGARGSTVDKEPSSPTSCQPSIMVMKEEVYPCSGENLHVKVNPIFQVRAGTQAVLNWSYSSGEDGSSERHGSMSGEELKLERRLEYITSRASKSNLSSAKSVGRKDNFGHVGPAGRSPSSPMISHERERERESVRS